MDKKYNLYILRAYCQVRAKQKMLGSDWYVDKNKKDIHLYKNIVCPEPVEPEIKKIEKYEILLDITNPNLKDLYDKIKEACPEFNNNKCFFLYWKYSSTKVLPISNYISYLGMVAVIATRNDNLYLVAREWYDNWMNNLAATYVKIPEDEVLINMVSPPQTVFIKPQEYHMNLVKAVARKEFTRTYSPPAVEVEKSPKEKGKKEEKPKSPKLKSGKKK